MGLRQYVSVNTVYFAWQCIHFFPVVVHNKSLILFFISKWSTSLSPCSKQFDVTLTSPFFKWMVDSHPGGKSQENPHPHLISGKLLTLYMNEELWLSTGTLFMHYFVSQDFMLCRVNLNLCVAKCPSQPKRETLHEKIISLFIKVN